MVSCACRALGGKEMVCAKKIRVLESLVEVFARMIWADNTKGVGSVRIRK